VGHPTIPDRIPEGENNMILTFDLGERRGAEPPV
jgi:hypothetical protein